MSDSNPYAPPPPAGDRPQNPTYNPYAPPTAHLGPSAAGVDDAESIRRQYLKHEASLKSFGCLYYWSGVVMMFLGGIALLMGFVTLLTEPGFGENGWMVVAAVIYGLIGWLYIWLGQGLRELQEKVRLLLTVFAVIGLLGFPIGTVISLYFLYLLHSEKGKRVMSPEYRQVVAATPHIKYQTPVWVWIFLIVLVGIFIFAIAVSV